MIEHTSGPWHWGRNGDKCAKNHAICSGPHVIAKVYGGGYPVGEGWSPRSQADARLIAAAPELLAALKGFLLGAPSDKDLAEVVGEDVVRETRAAIAKATR